MRVAVQDPPVRLERRETLACLVTQVPWELGVTQGLTGNQENGVNLEHLVLMVLLGFLETKENW